MPIRPSDHLSPPGLLQEIQELESMLHHPGVRCSREQLERLLHPQFHEVGRSGQPYSRAMVIQHLASLDKQPSVASGSHALAVLADGCVLLTYRSAHCQPDGSLTLHALRSSIWMRTSRGWQLYYHQGTPTPPPA